jgi:ubiquinone/menaquinone biosynthesis C-methylase UbiE
VFHGIAAAYNSGGTEFFADLGAALVRAAAIRPGARVMDAGCGGGAATIPAARRAGPAGHVTALDASADMLARAQTAARAAGLGNITWMHGDAEDPPVPSGSMDVVLASSVIQFLSLPRRAARNWHRLLDGGGTLALSWGIAQDPAWTKVMAVVDAAVPAPHPAFEAFLRRPPFDSPDAMAGMLSACGYTGITTHVQPLTTIYDNPRQWWQACLSQGPWVCWRHIPRTALEAARTEAFSLLEDMRGPDGMLRRTLRFGLTIATKPPTSSGRPVTCSY